MATTSTRSVLIGYSSDVTGSHTVSAASNTASPGSIELRTLASGANTITLPTGGSTVTGCTIVPPSSNTTSITLKGVSGDTGFRIHNTDPTTVTFHTTVTDFVLTTGGAITGVRLYWS